MNAGGVLNTCKSNGIHQACLVVRVANGLQLIAWSSGKAFAVWDGVASYQLDGGVTAHRGFDG